MRKVTLRVSMLALLLALSSPAFIQAQPIINSAQANLSVTTIVISGKNFGTSTPTVRLDGTALVLHHSVQPRFRRPCRILFLRAPILSGSPPKTGPSSWT